MSHCRALTKELFVVYVATTMVTPEMTSSQKAVTKASHHQTLETAGKWLKSPVAREDVKGPVQDVTLMRRFCMRKKVSVVKSQTPKGPSVTAIPQWTQLVILKTVCSTCACIRAEEMCCASLLHHTQQPARPLELQCTAGEPKDSVVRKVFFAVVLFFCLGGGHLMLHLIVSLPFFSGLQCALQSPSFYSDSFLPCVQQ